MRGTAAAKKGSAAPRRASWLTMGRNMSEHNLVAAIVENRMIAEANNKNPFKNPCVRV